VVRGGDRRRPQALLRLEQVRIDAFMVCVSVWHSEEAESIVHLLASVLHLGTSKYQEIALIDTKHFGKVC
jgi:hypothetical protein